MEKIMIWIRTIVLYSMRVYLFANWWLTVDYSTDQFVDERVVNKKIKQYEAWFCLARNSRIVKSSENGKNK